MNLPKQFTDKMKRLLGTEFESFTKSFSLPAQKGVTLNTSRLDRKTFESIADFEYERLPFVDNGYKVGSFRFAMHVLNHLGVIYSQEPSAMYPVELLDVKPNDICLDVCASPGGKSIQILEKLNNTGLLISNEIVYSRAKILDENISKMGFENSIITCESTETLKTLSMQFDKILVDAPCGAEGMMRKSNFDMFDYNPNMIPANADRQLEILNNIKGLLKTSGTLVYSTCTYDILENENVIARFLKDNPDFEIVKNDKFRSVLRSGIKIDNYATEYGYRIYPHLNLGEGQFMIALKKIGESEPEIYSKKTSIKRMVELSANELKIVKDTLKCFKLDNPHFLKKEDDIYLAPKITVNLKNLSVITLGVLVGTLQKNILKISHEFYHTCGVYCENKLELSLEQVQKYLHGDELDTDLANGTTIIVTYLNCVLGGGKVVNGKIKNYYKKNLRI